MEDLKGEISAQGQNFGEIDSEDGLYNSCVIKSVVKLGSGASSDECTSSDCLVSEVENSAVTVEPANLHHWNLETCTSPRNHLHNSGLRNTLPEADVGKPVGEPDLISDSSVLDRPSSEVCTEVPVVHVDACSNRLEGKASPPLPAEEETSCKHEENMNMPDSVREKDSQFTSGSLTLSDQTADCTTNSEVGAVSGTEEAFEPGGDDGENTTKASNELGMKSDLFISLVDASDTKENSTILGNVYISGERNNGKPCSRSCLESSCATPLARPESDYGGMSIACKENDAKCGVHLPCDLSMAGYDCEEQNEECELIDKEIIINNLHLAASIAKHLEPVRPSAATGKAAEILPENQCLPTPQEASTSGGFVRSVTGQTWSLSDPQPEKQVAGRDLCAGPPPTNIVNYGREGLGALAYDEHESCPRSVAGEELNKFTIGDPMGGSKGTLPCSNCDRKFLACACKGISGTLGTAPRPSCEKVKRKESSSGETVSSRESCSNSSSASSGASTFFSSSKDPFYHIGRFLDKVNCEPEQEQQKLWTFLASVVQKGLKSCPGLAKDQDETVKTRTGADPEVGSDPISATDVLNNNPTRSPGDSTLPYSCGDSHSCRKETSPRVTTPEYTAVAALNVPVVAKETEEVDALNRTNETFTCGEVISNIEDGCATSTVARNPMMHALARGTKGSLKIEYKAYQCSSLSCTAEMNAECRTTEKCQPTVRQSNLPDLLCSSPENGSPALSMDQGQRFMLGSDVTLTNTQSQEGPQLDNFRPEFLERLLSMGLITPETLSTTFEHGVKKMDLLKALLGSVDPKLPDKEFLWCAKDVSTPELEPLWKIPPPLDSAHHEMPKRPYDTIGDLGNCRPQITEDPISTYDSSIVCCKILSPEAKERGPFDLKSFLPQSVEEIEGIYIYTFLFSSLLFFFLLIFKESVALVIAPKLALAFF